MDLHLSALASTILIESYYTEQSHLYSDSFYNSQSICPIARPTRVCL